MTNSQEIIRPADATDLADVIKDAAAQGRALEIRSGGSKRDIGHPGRSRRLVDTGRLSGVVDYEPSELVLTVRPGTPLAEVEALLASRGQMLAFEPWDHGPLFGREVGAATIGGIVAAGVAGSRRVSAGGTRDHLLGFTAVSGRGELFKGGGKVVKNVTGYDVPKVIAGSWGQLAIMTELTLKVMPRPTAVATLALTGLSPLAAVQTMAQALGSPASPAAAAYVPPSHNEPAMVAIRLEGLPQSVDARASRLIDALAAFAPAQLISDDQADELWQSVRDLRRLAASEILWRIAVAPSQAAAVIEALERSGATWLCDWAGALIWAGAPGTVDVRSLAKACQGHATLVRRSLGLRCDEPVREQRSDAVAALAARLKQAFDPAGILDPERFH